MYKVIHIFAYKHRLVCFDKIVQSNTDIVEHCSTSWICPRDQCWFL